MSTPEPAPFPDSAAPSPTGRRLRFLPWPRDPRYIVCSDGTIIGPSGRELVGFVAKRTGYRRFNRYAAGRWSQHFVHVAVCETFHGPRPPGKWAAHRDGNKSDCSAENVAWKTYHENEADKIAHGTRAEGERHGCARLTAEQVREIRASDEPVSAFVIRFGVSSAAIRDARSGRTWRSVAR